MIEDLKIIYEKCIKLVEFIHSKGGGEIAVEFKKLVDVSYRKKKRSDVTALLHDLSQWASGISTDGKEIVAGIIESVENQKRNDIEEILKMKKRLVTYEDYQKIENYVNENWELLKEQGKLDSLNKMLANFEEEE